MKKNNLEWHNEKRKLSELTPLPENPRKLSQKQKSDLEKSLIKFNLVEVPAINTDGQIIAGHQRIAILIALGKVKEIDVRVPNRKLTKAEVREYNVRSNKNTGEWDVELLQSQFLIDDLIDWGFDKSELDELFNHADFDSTTEEADGDSNELRTVKIILPQEIYRLWQEWIERVRRIYGAEQSESRAFEIAIVEALNIPEESLK